MQSHDAPSATRSGPLGSLSGQGLSNMTLWDVMGVMVVAGFTLVCLLVAGLLSPTERAIPHQQGLVLLKTAT